MTDVWRGQKAIVTIEGTDTDVGILQEVEITVDKEIQELRGAGSIRRQDVQQTAGDVGVSASFMAWTMNGYKELVGTEVVDTIEQLADTSDVPLVDVKGTFVNNAGETEVITVKDVYFESLPIGGAMDGWISMDIDGTGAYAIFE